MIKTILWDFDGVILDSVNAKTQTFYDMYLPFGEDVAKKAVDHHKAHGGMSRFEKFKLYHKNFLGVELNEDQIKTMANEFSDRALNKVINSEYVPGSLEFIKTYHKDFSFYIISGTPDAEMKYIVEKKDLKPYFLEVMGSPKNKNQWVEELLNKNKITPNATLFIGDATSDFEAAKNFNLKFILRETEDNKDIFANLDVIKTKDLTNLKLLMEAL